MLKQIIESSRYLVVVAVLGSLVATIALLGFGVYDIADLLVKTFKGSVDSKAVVLKLIEIVDSFLLATVFLIIATGLYELFIDPTLDLPDWLNVNSLDDLKNKLVGTVIIVLGVVFLGNTARWTGDQNVAYLGVGIAAVIFALTFFLKKGK